MKLKYVLACLLCLTLLASGCSRNKSGEGDTTESGDHSHDHGMAGTTTAKNGNTSDITDGKKPIAMPTKNNNLQFDSTKEGIYNYCPSIMELADGTVYIYYCTNTESFQVVDYIGCRKGTRGTDGTIAWGEEKIVLAPGAQGAWDAHHVCDPSVIAGEFSYGGESYGYLMAYLGCTSYDNQENEIGLAVAKSPEGPFIKVGTEPFVKFTMDPDVTVFQWGVGQPSLVSMDKKGKVWMFYTKGDADGTRLIVDGWNLSDLDSPTGLLREEISANGLVDLEENQDFMNNADLVYDVENGRFFAVSDCHPNPKDPPNYISAHFRVTYFDKKDSFTQIKWEKLKYVGPVLTDFMRNHNTGVLRDAYGHLNDDGYLSIFYTKSDTGNSSLWSYRIYDYYVELPK